MNRKLVYTLIVIVIILIVVGTLISNTKKSPKEVTTTTIQNNQATNDINMQGIQITNITKVYASGITTISANMLNTTDQEKSVTIKIVLRDAQGNEVKNAIQVVDNLLPNRTKVLSTGISGDYSNTNDISFEIVQ